MLCSERATARQALYPRLSRSRGLRLPLVHGYMKRGSQLCSESAVASFGALMMKGPVEAPPASFERPYLAGSEGANWR